MPEFRTYAEMIAEANYPAVEGTYAVLAERLTKQRDRYADALREISHVEFRSTWHMQNFARATLADRDPSPVEGCTRGPHIRGDVDDCRECDGFRARHTA